MKCAVHQARGFTLMEMLIVIAMLGILTAIAIPSYTQYITRSKRAAAASTLIEAAGVLERNYTTNGCYHRTSVPDCQTGGGAALALGVDKAPREGRASYAVTVADFGARGQQFTLTATPCSEAGSCPAGSDNFNDAECGRLTLTQTGQKGLFVGGAASADPTLISRCWQR